MQKCVTFCKIYPFGRQTYQVFLTTLTHYIQPSVHMPRVPLRQSLVKGVLKLRLFTEISFVRDGFDLGDVVGVVPVFRIGAAAGSLNSAWRSCGCTMVRTFALSSASYAHAKSVSMCFLGSKFRKGLHQRYVPSYVSTARFTDIPAD